MNSLDTSQQKSTGLQNQRMRRAAALVGTALFAALLALAPIGAASPASAANTIAQCDGVYNAAAAQVQCSVTIQNSVDLATGAQSSIVTVAECIGAPAAVTCADPVTTSYPTTTTTVDQCNGSGNAGGSVVRCDVLVTNVVTNATAADQAGVTPATVNQCAGSGQGGGASTLNCDSYDTTTGATITQCNGSVNGGGAPTRVNCTVGPSTQTPLVPIVVNQCNGSVNGGGALAFCSTRLVNDIRVAAVVPPGGDAGATPVAAPVAGPSAAPTTPVDRGGSSRAVADTLANTGADTLAPAAFGLLALAIGGALSLVGLHRRVLAQRG
ncbi:MAG: hypothetical protein JWM50_2340 [Microbacteriaceae bacterium]|jgi:hypothetical protein|nr:hypothetical protein [Microbacteriaceae bacterium]